MARQIITLEVTPSGGEINVRCALWFPVTAGQEKPVPGFISQVKGSASPDATEATALESGAVVEVIKSYAFPDNTSLAAIQSNLVLFYNRILAYLATVPNPGKYYGKNYNGTTWS